MEKLIELPVPIPQIRGPFLHCYGRSKTFMVRIKDVIAIEDSKRKYDDLGEVYQSMVVCTGNRQLQSCHRAELLMDMVDDYYTGLYPTGEQHRYEDAHDTVEAGVRQSLAAMA